MSGRKSLNAWTDSELYNPSSGDDCAYSCLVTFTAIWKLWKRALPPRQLMIKDLRKELGM